MIEHTVEIPTKDGKATTFITHPERGGPFPVVIFYMDAPAIREELRDMARRHMDAYTFHGHYDDVLNVGGHMVGTEEIENALLLDDTVRLRACSL